MFLVKLEDWHAYFGHPNYQIVRSLVNQFQLPCSSHTVSSNKCVSCCLGKLHKLPLSLTRQRSTSPLELIYSDAWGPTPLCSSSRYQYFVIFIDDHSLFTWLFPRKCKSEVYYVFLSIPSYGWETINCSIKQFQSNWGREF